MNKTKHIGDLKNPYPLPRSGENHHVIPDILLPVQTIERANKGGDQSPLPDKKINQLPKRGYMQNENQTTSVPNLDELLDGLFKPFQEASKKLEEEIARKKPSLVVAESDSKPTKESAFNGFYHRPLCQTKTSDNQFSKRGYMQKENQATSAPNFDEVLNGLFKPFQVVSSELEEEITRKKQQPVSTKSDSKPTKANAISRFYHPPI